MDPGFDPAADSLRITTLTFPFQPDSSFTTREGERAIALGVSLYGALTGLVQWSVVDEPSVDWRNGRRACPGGW